MLITHTRTTTPWRLLQIVVWLAVSTPALAADKGTVYPYQIDESSIQQRPITTVVIAPGPLGKPARQYLREHEERIDSAVARYLDKKGITVADDSNYRRALDEAHSRFGSAYDASSDRIDMTTQQRILGHVLGRLQLQQPDLSAIIFTELISREVYVSNSLRRTARWDGVSRSPLMQGPGQGVPGNFDWSQPVDAVSLGIHVYSLEGKRLFTSAGGLSLTEAIDTTRSTPRYVRYRKVLSNKAQIKEGVQLAFHPLIPMKRYPVKN